MLEPSSDHRIDHEARSAVARSTTNPRPFFILGCPRSGTTLLQAMLNRHPQVAVPPELKLFCHYHRQPRWIRRKVVSRVASDLAIPLEHDWDDASTSTRDYFGEVTARYLERTQRTGITAIGEKSPENTSCIEDISETFPDATIIVLVRDGRQVAESLSRMPWLQCDVRRGALIWQFYMRAIADAVSRTGSNIHIVRYEDLVLRPEPVVQSLLTLLGVDAEEAAFCCQPNPDRDTEIFPDREAEWKSRSIDPISQAPTTSLDELSIDQLRTILSVCSQELFHWGYIPQSDVVSHTIGTRLANGMALTRIAAKLPVWQLVTEANRRIRCWLRKKHSPSRIMIPPEGASERAVPPKPATENAAH